jgi:hypothetical protein
MSKVLFFLFTMISISAFCQMDSLAVKNDKNTIIQKKFNSTNLEKYKNDKNFNYIEDVAKEDPSIFEQIYSWFVRQLLRFLEWLFGVDYAQGIFASVLSAIPYVIAAIVLFLILKFFLKVNSKSIVNTVKNKTIVSFSEEGEVLKSKDILKLIEDAILQKNYRLAVRYSYLNILKHLERKEYIIWEQQKTNEDYIKEIKSIDLKQSFVNLTRLYDFVWYGNFGINETEFVQIESDFKQTHNLIVKK